MNFPKKLFNSLSHIISTFFGIGFIPFAPGTFGSIAAFLIWISLPVYWFYNSTNHTVYWGNQLMIFPLFILFTVVGVITSTISENKYGHDASKIIFDEVIGYWVAVMFLPKTLMIAFYALVLFRVFDIAKPFPINKIQKLPAGFGIVADDILAGIYANGIIQILILVFPRFFY